MSARDIFNGSTGNYATLLILTDATGTPNTGVAWNTAGFSVAYKVDTGSEVVITLTSSNFRHIGGGKYYVDVADAVYASTNLGKLIQFYGSLTDSSVYGEQHRVVANNPFVTWPAAIWGAAFSGYTAATGTFGYVVASISTMIENVSGWRFVAKAVELVTDRLPDVLVSGRIKSVISDAQVESIADAVAAALLQLDPAYVLVRSAADDKDLTFSWPNSTDTVTGQVSIDNGDYVDVAGDIEYFRQDNGVHFYTLSYAAPDRPSEEGTARYKFTSVSHTMMATLRLDANAGGGTATIGDHAITRTFQVASGDKVSGVRMSLVGVDGKSVTTGSTGIAALQADNGTYTLRVAVPAGYDPVADSSVTIADADSTATVTLVSTVVAPAPSGQCNVSLPVTDGAGTGQVGATVKITFLRFAPGATPTATVIPPVPVQTSIAPGVVSVQLLRLGTYRATYSYGTGTKDFEFIVPDAATYEVVERV